MRRYSLNLALLAVVFALVALLTFITWLHMTSPADIAIKKAQDTYFEKLNKEQLDDAAQRAWKRLHVKHGYPSAVIYAPGQTPYYINKSGQRCRFV
jgi:hypothetical protein